jgi:hypothetical protein
MQQQSACRGVWSAGQMSEWQSGTTPSGEERLKAIRDEIVGDYSSFTEIAAALGCCERTVRNVVAKHNIRVVKINNKPHAKPIDFRRVLFGKIDPASPRPRGRPRKDRT